MSNLPLLPLLLCLFLLFFLSRLFHVSMAEVGTTAHYGPPYLPTACYGNDTSRFPGNSMFAAAGEGIWNNGAACGRQYLVRCTSSSRPEISCIEGTTIQIGIVDRASSLASKPSMSGVTMVLSISAFKKIAASSAPGINIEF